MGPVGLVVLLISLLTLLGLVGMGCCFWLFNPIQTYFQMKVLSLMIFKSVVINSITSAHSRNGSWLGLGLVTTAPPPSTQ